MTVEKLSDESLKDYEKALIAEREEAQNIIDEINNLQRKKIKSNDPDDKNSTTEEDGDSDSLEHEVYFLDQQYDKIKRINSALKRIYDKDYGLCQTCGELIQKERLRYLPYTSHCVNCKTKLENKKKKRK